VFLTVLKCGFCFDYTVCVLSFEFLEFLSDLWCSESSYKVISRLKCFLQLNLVLFTSTSSWLNFKPFCLLYLQNSSNASEIHFKID
jgi:hypothetical protein